MTFRVTVGIRFHNLSRIDLLERCLLSVAAQTGVKTDVCIAVQGIDQEGLDLVIKVAEKALAISGKSSLRILDVPNPGGKDIRSNLLNHIVDYHYELLQAHFLSFIDYDDIWFSHALSTLARSLNCSRYAISYADVHAADTIWTDQAFVVREIQDIYKISIKTKEDLRSGNFLPLHSYMFYTKDLPRDVLRYDETISRLEDYDVLLRIASSWPVTSSCRSILIGLYNFYTDHRQSASKEKINTMHNPFADCNAHSRPSEDPEELALAHIFDRYRGTEWKRFFGETF